MPCCYIGRLRSGQSIIPPLILRDEAEAGLEVMREVVSGLAFGHGLFNSRIPGAFSIALKALIECLCHGSGVRPDMFTRSHQLSAAVRLSQDSREH